MHFRKLWRPTAESKPKQQTVTDFHLNILISLHVPYCDKLLFADLYFHRCL